MTILISAVAFVVLLSLLILIHEWGHYKAAKLFGVTVEEFGFGLPPIAKTLFRHDGTAFTLNWIPFGGFVRLKGENALTEKQRIAKGSFGAATIKARLVILLAGVFMNLMLALVLLTIGFSAGRWVPTYTSLEQMEAASAVGEINLELGVMIDEVVSGGNAAKIGVPSRSVIRLVDDKRVIRPSDVSDYQRNRELVTYTVSMVNNDGTLQDETTEYEVPLDDGKSGVVLMPYTVELSAPQRNVVTAFMLALRETKVMTVQTVKGIGTLFVSLASRGSIPDSITGIVGIAQLTHGAVQQGFMDYLRLVALLSLSLAILNVLPFPALDGGRVLFVLAELISRRPVNRQFELTTNAIGFTFLLLLILLITFHDIVRLF